MKKFTDQEVDVALKTAPKAIQEVIAEPSGPATIVKTFQTKYALHIDTLGIIAGLTRNMLLGLVSPQEFQSELIGAGIQEPQTKEIMNEINEKIFVPLQQKMRQSGGGVPQPKALPAMQPTPQKPPALIEPPTPKPQTLPPAPRPATSPPAPIPQRVEVLVPRPSMAPPPSPRPIPPTPANLPGQMPAFNRRLEDREEPHIEVTSSRQSAVGSQPQQPPMPQIPRPPSTPAPSSQHQASSVKPLATYSVDPYREQFDDKN